MSYFLLKQASARPLSLFLFASLRGAKAYLEWHYSPALAHLTVDPRGQITFTVAGTTILVSDEAHPSPVD